MQKINCPACGHGFHAEEVISKQMARDLQKEYEEKEKKMMALVHTKVVEFEAQKKEFDQLKKKENELFMERLEKERLKILEQLKVHQEKEFTQKLQQADNERIELSSRLEKLSQAAIENEMLKRKLESQHSQIELELQQKWSTDLAKERDQIRLDEQRRTELKQKEFEKQLEDQRKIIETLQRKSQQGSMQLQGEVQEIAIEEYLREQFPLDEIEEIRKGARGADCLQRIHTRNMENVGTIYFESKRTKDFQAGWIDKLKDDMRLIGADLGILISQTMPKDMPFMGERQGIWICSFDEYKALIPILRQGMIQVAEAMRTQVNRTDKLNMLYDYLTGSDFKMQIEAIVEGFKQMQEDLQKEKIAMHRIWAQREKTIEKVLLNTSQFYGNVKGIAGQAIPMISILDLPG
jgi:hypothetical protein